MPDISPGFAGLKITNYYKYILYVAGVILILSLFVPAQGIDNERLRHIAFLVVLGGLGIWFLKTIVDFIINYLDYLVRNNELDKNSGNAIGLGLRISEYIVQISIWIILLVTTVKI